MSGLPHYLRLIVAAGALAWASATSAQNAAPFSISPDGGASTSATPPPATPAPPVAAPAVETRGGSRPDRLILPVPRLRLEGEIASRSWQVHVTNAQAALPVRLSLAYSNSIMVMPEGSRLRASINGQTIFEIPLTAAEHEASHEAAVPPNLLKPGPNIVRFDVVQRHRTDCSVSSTYELWTEIIATGTGFSFKGADAARLLGLDDLPAAPVDESGANHILVVAPSANRVSASQPMIDLAQGLALRGRYAHSVITVMESSPATVRQDALVVAFGTANELGGVLAEVPGEAEAGSMIGFVRDPVLGPSTLVVSGRSWSDVGNAIKVLSGGFVRPLDVTRSTFFTSSWRAPDAPFLTRGGRFSLLDAGVPTQEFSGRRFRTEFAVALPSDFYAEAYGEATLLLDAAYDASVLPGNHIDIVVNGQIASTVALNSTSGGIFRALPITVPLRHFRPGVNTIAITADLATQSDATCAPGATLAGEPRFALFETTAFVMPEFARIARLPDLSRLSGTGFPYSRSGQPIPLMLGRHDPQTYSAATTFVAKLAQQAGRMLPVNTLVTAANPGEGHVIFIGATTQLPATALERTGLADDLAISWKPLPVETSSSAEDPARAYNEAVQKFSWRADALQQDNSPLDPASSDQVMERWREDLAGGGGLSGSISRLEDRMQQTFDISFASLRLTPAEPPPFRPSPRASLLVAQGYGASGPGTWTVVTAPSGEELARSVALLTGQDAWAQVAGRITTLQADRRLVQVQPIATFNFVPTQPFSLANARLIAANWLSSNILPYALLLGLLGVTLGVATSMMLSRLGRNSR